LRENNKHTNKSKEIIVCVFTLSPLLSPVKLSTYAIVMFFTNLIVYIILTKYVASSKNEINT